MRLNDKEELSDLDDIFEDRSNDNGPNIIERYDNSAENDILDEDLEFFLDNLNFTGIDQHFFSTIRCQL